MALEPIYTPKKYEAELYKRWQENGLGSPEKQEEQTGQLSGTYTNLMPPPNLTGVLHAGHAFGHYVMDTLTRIHRQRGEKCLWYPGVDHAGIQLEGVIDKAIKAGEFDEELKHLYDEDSREMIINRRTKTRSVVQTKRIHMNLKSKSRENLPQIIKDYFSEDYLKLAWKKANEWRDNQAKQSAVLGDTPDYSRSLFTLDDRASEMVNFAFKKYYEDGLIYKKSYLINWSVGLQTALSDVPEDIGHEKRKDPFVTFEYRHDAEALVVNDILNQLNDDLVGKITQHFEQNPILVSTVRSETIFADKAVLMHPEILKKWLAKGDLTQNEQEILENNLINEYLTLGCKIEGMVQGIPLIFGEEVDPDFGTGALKITPAHDMADYEIFHKYLGGEFEQAVGRDGRLTEICGDFAGLTVEEGRKKVIVTLIETGYVPHQLDEDGNMTNELEIDWNYEHNVTICERSKTIVEPLISEEFFLSYRNTFSSKHSKQIKNLVFDFGDVVFYEKKHRMIQKISDLYGIQEGVDYQWETIVQMLRSKEFNPYTLEFWIEFCGEVNAKMNHEELFESWLEFNQNPLQIEQTVEVMSRYKLQGFGIYYITNRHEEGMIGIRNHPVFELFDGGIGDFEIGVSKPDPEIYQEFINRFGIDPEETIFIDDRLENIETANSLGFKTVHFDQKTTQLSEHIEMIQTSSRQTSLVQQAQNGIQETHFYPEEFEQLAADYIRNIKDWCISRDLVWGHKIPIWYNLDINPEKFFYSAVDIQKNQEIQNSISISAEKPQLAGNWVQEEKILDTWFSSCLWPLSTLGYLEHIKGNTSDFETFYPTQDMVTAREIFYAWIVRMIMLGKYFTGKTPFENLIITPTILDEQGKKMSKSLKNGLDPVTAIDNYSSDSLRLAMLGGMIPNRNMRLGGDLANKLMERYRNFGNKVWNIARFFEFKSEFLKPIEPVPLSSGSLWIATKFETLVNQLDSHAKRYEFAHSIQEMYSFVWDDYADWYIEYLKTDSHQLPFAYELFKQLIIVLSPYMPFETQVIWSELYQEKNLLAFEVFDINWISKYDSSQVLLEEFTDIIELVAEVRSLRGLFAIDPAIYLEIYSSSELFERYRDFLKLSGRVELILSDQTKTYYDHKLGYSIDILSYIKDKNAEIIRTQKNIESLQKQIRGLESQLANQKFIEHADSEVIQEKHTQLTERNSELVQNLRKLELFNQ
jgi:HAD superfamily hydrolase (TIGR01509 family)